MVARKSGGGQSGQHGEQMDKRAFVVRGGEAGARREREDSHSPARRKVEADPSRNVLAFLGQALEKEGSDARDKINSLTRRIAQARGELARRYPTTPHPVAEGQGLCGATTAGGTSSAFVAQPPSLDMNHSAILQRRMGSRSIAFLRPVFPGPSASLACPTPSGTARKGKEDGKATTRWGESKDWRTDDGEPEGELALFHMDEDDEG